jgi:hypothetical protein
MRRNAMATGLALAVIGLALIGCEEAPADIAAVLGPSMTPAARQKLAEARQRVDAIDYFEAVGSRGCRGPCVVEQTGFEWARTRAIDKPSRCDSKMAEFNDGCRTYVAALDRAKAAVRAGRPTPTPPPPRRPDA